MKFVGFGVIFYACICVELFGVKWWISVIDNGIGINLDYWDCIFGMFKWLYICDEYFGSGIGLVLVKKIVEWYGGEVGVEDVLIGMGSWIWFIFLGVGG